MIAEFHKKFLILFSGRRMGLRSKNLFAVSLERFVCLKFTVKHQNIFQVDKTLSKQGDSKQPEASSAQASEEEVRYAFGYS